MSKQPKWSAEPKAAEIDWKASIAEVLERGKNVPEVSWCRSGEDSAHEVFPGKLQIRSTTSQCLGWSLPCSGTPHASTLGVHLPTEPALLIDSLCV